MCGGLAEYLNVDPNIVRLAAIVLTIFTGGAFIIAYVIAIVVMPDAPRAAPVWNYAPTDRPGQPGYPGSYPGTTPQGDSFPGYPGMSTGSGTPKPPTD